MTDALDQLRARRERFEELLIATLPRDAGTPELLGRAMRYSVLAGGKRIRPLLVYAACDALEVDYQKLDAVACAIEIIHTYSLIHDDLPAMDDDDYRRGRPTCHRAFDVATAILAGDALQALAFEILAGDAQLRERPDAMSRIIHGIAAACGPAGMAGGQVLDLAAVGSEMDHEALVHMHRLKTGALIKVCALAPAYFARAEPDLIAKLEVYGDCVGLAFQIHDDILDVTGTQAQTGKSTQKDARQDKPTFPGLLGLEHSRAEAYRLRDRAQAELRGFPGDCSLLECLAAVAVDRES
ncbi:MAG: polyprenyl synthetase family protein [Xanthomonadales bacterium]|nr:polyprenyl synthetase family protein [Xanthomonadales bacterium]